MTWAILKELKLDNLVAKGGQPPNGLSTPSPTGDPMKLGAENPFLLDNVASNPYFWEATFKPLDPSAIS
jgi:hypothetical protein